MYIPLSDLPDSAKVWIYQSDKKLTAPEKEILKARLHSFTDSWLVHGEKMKTSFDIIHDQFVVLAADDAASGCSIDSSVQVMRHLAGELWIDFFNRTAIAFEIDNAILLIPMADLKSAVHEKIIGPDTPVFNNAVSTLGEFRKSWPAPARTSWVNRYFPKESVEK